MRGDRLSSPTKTQFQKETPARLAPVLSIRQNSYALRRRRISVDPAQANSANDVGSGTRSTETLSINPNSRLRAFVSVELVALMSNWPKKRLSPSNAKAGFIVVSIVA